MALTNCYTKLADAKNGEPGSRLKGCRNVPAEKEQGNFTEVGRLKFGEGMMTDLGTSRSFVWAHAEQESLLLVLSTVDLDNQGRLRNSTSSVMEMLGTLRGIYTLHRAFKLGRATERTRGELGQAVMVARPAERGCGGITWLQPCRRASDGHGRRVHLAGEGRSRFSSMLTPSQSSWKCSGRNCLRLSADAARDRVVHG